MDNNPRLTRKFDKWRGENFNLTSSLAKSIVYPISRIRLETNVAVIRFKELPVGFRVLSAEAALIASLSNDANHLIRGAILSYNTKYPGKIICNVMCVVEAIDASSRVNLHSGYGFGDYSNLATIHEYASSLNRIDLIKKLNKEL
jgi:hypothetical protein